MSTINFLAGKIVSLKDDGSVNAGGKVYWTVADGTFSTPIATYSDQALSVANANPLILNAAGRGKAYFGGNADVKITTSDDVTIYTERNVSPQNVKTVYTKSTNFTIDSTYLDAIAETTAVLTATLSSATSLGSGFQVTIINTAASAITLARASAGDTINGTAANITIPANSASTITVNFGTTGFITNTVGYPVSIANGGTGATTAATARTALAVGGLAEDNTWTGANRVSSTAPQVIFIETDAAADNKRWSLFAQGQTLYLRVINDADTVAADILVVQRTGSTVDSVTLGGTAVSVTNALTVGGLATLIGGQLKFPATQVPSADVNTLDDYEEGTWTPSIGGTATYGGGGQLGRYVKIGRKVDIELYLLISSLGTGSTTIISGLPYTSGATHLSTAQCGFWFGAATSCVGINAIIGAGSTSITVGALAAASTGSGSAAVFATGTNLRLQMSYMVD